MPADNKKISIRQASFIFLIIVFSPAVRFVPTYSVDKAEQAAWLSPIPAIIVFILLVLVWNSICKKFKS